MAGFLVQLQRKKHLEEDLLRTPLKRCLNTFDLTLFGIGHMIGSGIYVLTGAAVKNMAGSGAILSYVLAGFAAFLASLCYAELGSKVPKAGSAYTYTYVIVGEIWAFIVGWNMILEYMIGSSAVGRAWSGTLNNMLGDAVRNGTLEAFGPITVPFLSDYLDFVALAVVLLISFIVAIGAKVSVNFNSVLTFINITFIVLVLGLGFYIGDAKNWTTPNGFFPYGISGVFAGAATCFFGYIGFEGIAMGGEEAKEPNRSIPIASGLAMLIATTLYTLMATVFTYMVPYTQVNLNAPFPDAFLQYGWHWAQFIVGTGSLVGMTTTLLGFIYSLPRIVYAMASDGLIFRIFARVNETTKTPVISTIVFGLLSGLLALVLDLETLVELMSIGTLLSFTMVAASVIILRYQDKGISPLLVQDFDASIEQMKEEVEVGPLQQKFRAMLMMAGISQGKAAVWATLVLGLCFLSLGAVILHGYSYLQQVAWWAVLLIIFISALIVLTFSVLLMLEQHPDIAGFKVPLVPLVPALSMMINLMLMMELNKYTWIRLAAWVSLGLVIYLAYGLRNSSEQPLASTSNGVNYGTALTETKEMAPVSELDQKTKDKNSDDT